MKMPLAHLGGVAGVILTLAAISSPAHASDDEGLPADPLLWLEEIEGEESLDWVRARNAESLAELESDSRYESLLAESEAILNATDRIPYARCHGDWVSNFWQDETHVRGIWRRATLESYRTDDPDWETVFDVDALAEAEGESWVLKSFSLLRPDLDRALVSLSRGGKDAVEVREYDLTSKSFVEGGFFVPEAKSDISWLDRNTLLVATDLGEGSLTESGYPRFAQRWSRGTALEDAPVLFEGKTTDVGAWGTAYIRPEGTTGIVIRSRAFYDAEYQLIDGDRLLPIPVQTSAGLETIYDGQFIFRLREDWTPTEGADAIAAGTLFSFSVDEFRKSGALPPIEIVFAPDDRTTVDSISPSKSSLWISLLHNVKGRVRRAVHGADGWTTEELDLPDTGRLGLNSVDPWHDTVFLGYQDFLTPDRIFELRPDDDGVDVLKTLPERFDADGLVAEQFEAVSADGERIPYFLVHRADVPFDGTTPTFLYGYGGFEISQEPRYLAHWGKLWLERGGAFAMANGRGGGEFGPRWHRAALGKNRHVAHDDFIAVGEDLVKRKVTSPEHLGIMGGSQGGLLVGVALTQRPELYRAVVCQVPLLDMMRYTKLLAGASWAAEYGDPADPEMREVILKWSPYQNLREGVDYPSTFFVTSTKDDRVHPGHARKMAARMLELGAPVRYFENIEGGHSASANRLQRARRVALEFVYLSQELGLE